MSDKVIIVYHANCNDGMMAAGMASVPNKDNNIFIGKGNPAFDISDKLDFTNVYSVRYVDVTPCQNEIDIITEQLKLGNIREAIIVDHHNDSRVNMFDTLLSHGWKIVFSTTKAASVLARLAFNNDGQYLPTETNSIVNCDNYDLYSIPETVLYSVGKRDIWDRVTKLDSDIHKILDVTRDKYKHPADAIWRLKFLARRRAKNFADSNQELVSKFYSLGLRRSFRLHTLIHNDTKYFVFVGSINMNISEISALAYADRRIDFVLNLQTDLIKNHVTISMRSDSSNTLDLSSFINTLFGEGTGGGHPNSSGGKTTIANAQQVMSKFKPAKWRNFIFD